MKPRGEIHLHHNRVGALTIVVVCECGWRYDNEFPTMFLDFANTQFEGHLQEAHRGD